MSTRLTMLPALVAGLLAAGPVMAQGAATPTPATPAPSAPASAAPAGATHRDAMVERRIQELHSRLKITQAQQQPFDAFANAMRQNAQRMGQFRAEHAGLTQSGTAPDLMKAYADFTAAHASDVQSLVGPFETLYAALSPEQKKLADESFRDFARSQQAQEARAPRGT